MAPTTDGGDGTGQGSPAVGSKEANKAPAQAVGQESTKQASDDGSSSPLVPILIAIAVLAAISLAAVMIRQRRQRQGSTTPVSSRAS